MSILKSEFRFPVHDCRFLFILPKPEPLKITPSSSFVRVGAANWFFQPGDTDLPGILFASVLP